MGYFGFEFEVPRIPDEFNLTMINLFVCIFQAEKFQHREQVFELVMAHQILATDFPIIIKATRTLEKVIYGLNNFFVSHLVSCQRMEPEKGNV